MRARVLFLGPVTLGGYVRYVLERSRVTDTDREERDGSETLGHRHGTYGTACTLRRCPSQVGFRRR
jgi:hypothetical protein